jgi:tRNA (guanine-N7-)-methyltransferase
MDPIKLQARRALYNRGRMSDTPSPAAAHTAPSDTAPSARNRPIRSFVLRTGRTTVGQAKALDELGPQYLIPYQNSTIDLIAACASFPWASGQNDSQNSIKMPAETPHKVILEIGFGMGEATAHIAKLMPNDLYLACEVHPPGVGALLKRIGDEGIGNIRIIQHDAVQVLNHMLAPNSLDGVHIFFPDPWHKKRHNKRRLVQPPLVALLASRIKPGGYIHCATDWQEYAEQILQVLSNEPSLVNTAPVDAATGADGYAPKPDYRPLTKFENRGIKLGHGVWDVVFCKRAS